MNEPWRDLKPGDAVRIVRVPSEYTNPKPGYWFDPETVSVFQSLVDANAVLTIDHLDQFGRPWTESFEIDETGQITVTGGVGHSLALDDDSWERVA